MTKEELKEEFKKAANDINTTIETYDDYLKIMGSFIGETNPLEVIRRFSYNNHYILDQLRYIIYNLPDNETNKTKS